MIKSLDKKIVGRQRTWRFQFIDANAIWRCPPNHGEKAGRVARQAAGQQRVVAVDDKDVPNPGLIVLQYSWNTKLGLTLNDLCVSP